MKIINCGREYSDQILEIFNDAIANSTALYEYEPRTIETMQKWFDIKEANQFPVIGIINEQNDLKGFGSYGTFRNFPANKFTVEHSLYVHPHHRGKGIGKILLQEIIRNAINQKYHCMVAGIDSSNEQSIALHKKFGFEFSGRIRHAGYKFNKWLDLDFYQLILDDISR
jgi:phosphinothricin acetyltransferase